MALGKFLVTDSFVDASCGVRGVDFDAINPYLETEMNESNADRIGRVVVGVALLIVGFGVLSGVLAVLAIVVGAILTLTGAIGFCPIYAVLKTGTRKVTGA